MLLKKLLISDNNNTYYSDTNYNFMISDDLRIMTNSLSLNIENLIKFMKRSKHNLLTNFS